MNASPKGWAEETLGGLGEWRGGGTPNKSNSSYWTNGDIPWVSPKDMKQTFIDGAEDHITADAIKESATQLISDGSVLIVTRSGILRHTLPVGITTCEVAINQDLKALTPSPAVDPVFAGYQIRSLGRAILSTCAKSGTTVDSIDFERLKGVTFAIPPLPEQRRIVAKIDSLTGKSKRARDHLDHIPRLVEKYKQAVLAAAFRGELTREWRAEMRLSSEAHPLDGMPVELADWPLPRTWAASTMAQAATNHDGRRVPVRASDRAARRGRYPYFGASGIIDQIDDYLFDGQYLLIGEDGANLVSRSTPIAFLASGQFWVNNHAHILQANQQTSNEWLCWFINMISLVPYVTGSAQPKLTQAALNRIGVPLPPLDEQGEVLRRIDVALTWINRLASEATSARKLIDHLDQAVLAKAFRGELVPQDPADEPASVLLERIRAERGEAPKARRGRRTQ